MSYELEKRIIDLEKKVADLERRGNTPAPAEPPPDAPPEKPANVRRSKK